MKYFHFSLLLVVFTAGGNLHAQKKDPPTFEKARDAIIDARKKIDTSEIEMVIKDESRDPNTVRTFRIWWDEKHQRKDMIPSEPEPVIVTFTVSIAKKKDGDFYIMRKKNYSRSLSPLRISIMIL